MKHLTFSKYPENRRYILIFRSVHGTTNVVNYMADNNHLNTFLAVFDIWHSGGHHILSDDNNHAEVCFEMNNDFYDLAKTESMQNAFKCFGVNVEFE